MRKRWNRRRLSQPVAKQLSQPLPPSDGIPADLRVQPQERLCAKFDATSVARFRVASRGAMGVRVVDNCAEEHIM